MSDPSGEEILKANMAALEEGKDLPYGDDYEPTEEPPEDIKEDIKQEEPEEVDDAEELEEELDEDIEEEIDDESEEIAKKDGYMTKEEWVASGKDEDDYMTQEEFAKVGKLRDGKETRQQLSKKFVQMESTMKELVTSTNKMIEDAKSKERAKVLAELQEQKKEAIEFQDAEGAADIERKIVAHEAEEPVKKEAIIDDVPDEVKTWYDSNDSWYNVDAAATGLLNAQLVKHEKSGKPFSEGIELAMSLVKKNFPYHFEDGEPDTKEIPTRRPRVASEKSQKRKSQVKTKSFADLDPEMAKIAKKAAKASGLTEAEYMENL